MTTREQLDELVAAVQSAVRAITEATPQTEEERRRFEAGYEPTHANLMALAEACCTRSNGRLDPDWPLVRTQVELIRSNVKAMINHPNQVAATVGGAADNLATMIRGLEGGLEQTRSERGPGFTDPSADLAGETVTGTTNAEEYAPETVLEGNEPPPGWVCVTASAELIGKVEASLIELVDRAKGINSPELSDVEKIFLVEMLETALAQLQGPRDRAS